MPLAPDRLNVKDDDLRRVQESLYQSVTSMVGIPILDGDLMTGVVLGTTPADIVHRLQRLPRGWVVVGKNADARVWSTSRTRTTLLMVASAAVTVDLWVF